MFDGMQALLVRKYGDEIGTWLARRVASMFRKIRDVYCADNFRVCDTAITEEVADYNERKAQGCCGSTFETVTHYASGRTFRYGCNYGH